MKRNLFNTYLKLLEVLFIPFILFASCTNSKVPCLDENSIELKTIKLENNSHKWNCGIKELILSKQEKDRFCGMFSKIEETEKKNIQVNNWCVDIVFNYDEKKFFKNYLGLCNHPKNGYVFYKKGKSLKNDDLAIHIEELLGIRRPYSKTPCP